MKIFLVTFTISLLLSCSADHLRSELAVTDTLVAPKDRYQKALTHIRDAIECLRPAVTSGDTVAIKLYNKINPVRKRKVGTVVLCNDGTTSNSKRRHGTCSMHGGVKDWDHPVYEEYREYGDVKK